MTTDGMNEDGALRDSERIALTAADGEVGSDLILAWRIRDKAATLDAVDAIDMSDRGAMVTLAVIDMYEAVLRWNGVLVPNAYFEEFNRTYLAASVMADETQIDIDRMTEGEGEEGEGRE